MNFHAIVKFKIRPKRNKLNMKISINTNENKNIKRKLTLKKTHFK